MCLLSVFYGVIATWNLLEMNSSTVDSTVSVSTACQSAALSTRLSSTARSSSAQLVQQFKPPKSFKFPKRKFGKKGEERAFRAAWCEKYDWLHYDVNADAAFCYFCMRAEHEKKFLASKKHEPAFITNGYTYLGLALKNQSSSDNPIILATERYWMTSCKSRL